MMNTSPATIRTFIEGGSWWLLWLAVVCALINAVPSTRELLGQVRTESGRAKLKALGKLVLDWAIVIVTFLGALSSQWSSETAERKLGRLERLIHPRSLSDTTKETLQRELARIPAKGPVAVIHLQNDFEAAAFAKELASVFRSSGFATTEHAHNVLMIETPIGIRFMVNSNRPPYADGVLMAFHGQGLVSQAVVAKTVPTNEMHIFVGQNPPNR